LLKTLSNPNTWTPCAPGTPNWWKKTRQEPLCIAYDLFIDQKDPGHFIFIEQWPDQAALDAHCQTEHFTRLVPQINAYQARPCRVLLMDGF
jgi:quinol monooxygenase YgiN